MYAFVTLWFEKLEMVLILLIEVAAFYMQMVIIKIGVLGNKKLISVTFKACWCLIRSLFDIDFYKLSEKDINKSRFLSWLRTWNRTPSNRSFTANRWHNDNTGKVENKAGVGEIFYFPNKLAELLWEPLEL